MKISCNSLQLRSKTCWILSDISRWICRKVTFQEVHDLLWLVVTFDDHIYKRLDLMDLQILESKMLPFVQFFIIIDAAILACPLQTFDSWYKANIMTRGNTCFLFPYFLVICQCHSYVRTSAKLCWWNIDEEKLIFVLTL